jgi:hypothetical protein
MSGRLIAQCRRRLGWCVAGAMVLAITWGAESAWAQGASTTEAPASPAAETSPAPEGTPVPSGGIVQTGCSSCSGGLFGHGEPLTMDDIGGAGDCGENCLPNSRRCGCCCTSDNCVGRFFCGLYDCICCPDPCYIPVWTPVQDAAFFTDAVRPRTQMKIRVDAAWDFRYTDRGEWFMARFNTVPENQLGPGGSCAPANLPGKGPHTIWKSANYEDLTLYMESGTDRLGAFVQTTYREIDPTVAPLAGDVGKIAALPLGAQTGVLDGACNVSGFADIIAGAKSVLLDCELIQIGLEFKTYIPAGNFTKGLGTGHVSLEPSILFGVKLAPTWYLQGQTAYWIPIAGDFLYMSNVWHNHLSLNHVLWRPCKDIQLVGTFEASEFTFFQGSYTETNFLVAVPLNAPNAINPAPNMPGTLAPVAIGANAVMASIGPGIRLFICNKIDIGVGSAIAVTGRHLEEEIVRTEFRWRF